MNTRQRLLLSAQAAESRSHDPARHKCFVSYHADDADEVIDFLDTFGHVFIPRVIGVTEEDDFIDSENTDYVMDQIREKYLRDSTVTIAMVGRCTWARRYIDWEIYSSLRPTTTRSRNGLMALTLPSVASDSNRQAPARVSDNISGTNSDAGFARWWKYPTTAGQVQGRIETVFGYRTTRAHLVDNSRARRLRSANCT